jgi:hypothetical protein
LAMLLRPVRLPSSAPWAFFRASATRVRMRYAISRR